MDPLLDLTDPPADFFTDPHPCYQQLRDQAPVCLQPDGSYLLSTYALLDQVYKETLLFSSDKQQVFKPKLGDTALFEHHTISRVFNDPPLPTRVRKIMVGAMS